eukprot:747117-Hanusia_phi.AAC.3
MPHLIVQVWMSHDSEEIECTVFGESDHYTRAGIYTAACAAVKTLKITAEFPEVTWEEAANQQPAKSELASADQPRRNLFAQVL